MIFGTDEKEGKTYGKCKDSKKNKLERAPRSNSNNKKWLYTFNGGIE